MNVSYCIGELLLIAGKCFPVNPEIAREDLNTNYPYETTAIDGYRADDLQRTLYNSVELLRYLKSLHPTIYVDHTTLYEGPGPHIRIGGSDDTH